MYINYYSNYCSNNCIAGNYIDTANAPYKASCTSPVNQKCYVGIGSNSSSGILTTCSSGYNYCQVIKNNKLFYN